MSWQLLKSIVCGLIRVSTALISVLCRVVLRRYHKTSALALRVHDLHDIDEFLFIVHGPVDLVVVARSQVNHDVLISEEKHYCARIIKLIHRVEIGNLADVHTVKYGKMFFTRSAGSQGSTCDAGILRNTEEELSDESVHHSIT